MKQALFAIFVAALFCAPLSAQNHTSVNLDDQIYQILEQAEMRGLVSPLSGVRPYTRSVVINAINELLRPGNARNLKPVERQILEGHLEKFATPEPGLNWGRGTFYAETELGKAKVPLNFNLNLGMDFEISSAFIPVFGETHVGTELWVQFDFFGDIGRNVSYGFFNDGGIVKQPRRKLGTYNTYYEGFEVDPDGPYNSGEFENREIEVYSWPLAHFPFSYKQRWEGSIFSLSNLSGHSYWPETLAGGYSMNAEVTAAFLENRFIMRVGRLRREWGSMPLGTSLIFNSAARPFLAAEFELRPFSWVSLSSLTGILDYSNTGGIKDSAMTSQNAFSITMLQFRFRNYLFIDFMDAVIWPKRFELAYMAPINLSFFSQNNIGDFDNMALAMNIRAQYPGLGSAWFSVFADEFKVSKNMYNYDRTMIAYQAGFNIPLPILAFSSLRLSYTKINPYTYTHNRNYNPWYGDLQMETGWMNHGVALGHYLPPNSDEYMLQFRTMPTKSLTTTLQYQMIRRGADYGSGAVDGSHLLSELDPERGPENPVTYRFFLRDGAYQWMHIARIGADWKLPNLPVTLFGETGVVFSYFTNIEGPANNADLNKGDTPRPQSFHRINTPEYPMSTTFITRIGFRIFR